MVCTLQTLQLPQYQRNSDQSRSILFKKKSIFVQKGRHLAQVNYTYSQTNNSIKRNSQK